MSGGARCLRLVLAVAASASCSPGAAPAAVPSTGAVHGAHVLQALVDAADPGALLQPPPGRYLGPLLIAKPLHLDGRGAVTIDGAGQGTVVRVVAPGVSLEGLTVRGTGGSHDQLDAAILVEADSVRVAFNTIDDALFGVLVKGGAGALVCGNRIRSKRDEEVGLRGDGVRLWNASGGTIFGNDVDLARDVSVANSTGVRVERNRIRHGRYALHLLFAPGTEVLDNELDANLTGVAALYSPRVLARGNRVRHMRGVSGVGLTFKESGEGRVEGNDVVHCAVGVRINTPTSREGRVEFLGNRFAHNVAGIDFYGEGGGHVLRDNVFEKNLSQVTVSGPMSARGNDWLGNSWDDYEGFDGDGDGVGDTPYELYAFADRIWMETPPASFFRNAPAFELLDFLERLAPFAAPQLTLADARPRVRAPSRPAVAEAPFAPSCP